MAEKAEIMKIAVEGGVYDLDAIRNGYNEFAKGAYIDIWDDVNTVGENDVAATIFDY